MIMTKMTMGIIVCFAFMLGVSIIFFSKEREKTLENKYFTAMIIENVAGLIIHLLADYAGFNYIPVLSTIILKLVLYYYIIFSVLFLSYLFIILKIKNTKLFIKLTNSIAILTCILITVLPEQLYIDSEIGYTYGPDTKAVFAVSFIAYFLVMILFILKYKNLTKKERIYITVFLIGLFIATNIQKAHPEMQVSIMVETALCCLMCYTLESPDVEVGVYNVAKTQAIKAGRAKDDFLSSMSHELRTPLNAIVCLSEMIKDNSTDPDSRSDAKEIVVASQDLLELVNSILNVNSIENNTLDLEESNYDLNKINNDLVKMLDIRLYEKNVNLVTNFSSDIPKTLYGDGDKLKTIMTNLLSNAIKYTDKGIIEYNVSCINKGDICKLEITVKDTGRGISKEQQEHLFTKFYRREEDKDSDIKGVGLGLAITKSLVDLMEGTIKVESEENVGSTFTVKIDQKIIEQNDVEVL